MGFRHRHIAVFCGSASGQHYDYSSEAFDVGQSLAKASRHIIYGGGQVGLMGAVADGCLDAGGNVIGVMPRALVEREIAHQALTELIIVEDMHERKAVMAGDPMHFCPFQVAVERWKSVLSNGHGHRLDIIKNPLGYSI